MTFGHRVLFAFLACGVLTQGCSPMRLSIEPSASEYTVTVLLLEVSARNAALLQTDPAGNLSPVVRDKDTVLTRFPTIHVLPGEMTEANTQQTVEYPSAFDAEGMPTELSTTGIGDWLRVTFVVAESPEFDVFAEHAVLLQWKTVEVTPGRAYRYPSIERQSVQTTIEPNLGQLQVIGVSEKPTIPPTAAVFLARIDPPVAPAHIPPPETEQ
jgi:hypothetical protein